jgi:hypothetical protein
VVAGFSMLVTRKKAISLRLGDYNATLCESKKMQKIAGNYTEITEDFISSTRNE